MSTTTRDVTALEESVEEYIAVTIDSCIQSEQDYVKRIVLKDFEAAFMKEFVLWSLEELCDVDELDSDAVTDAVEKGVEGVYYELLDVVPGDFEAHSWAMREWLSLDHTGRWEAIIQYAHLISDPGYFVHFMDSGNAFAAVKYLTLDALEARYKQVTIEVWDIVDDMTRHVRTLVREWVDQRS